MRALARGAHARPRREPESGVGAAGGAGREAGAVARAAAPADLLVWSPVEYLPYHIDYGIVQ